MIRAGVSSLAILLAVGCGGGASSPSAASAPQSGEASRIVSLDSVNFDALVLAAPRPSLVEFYSPT